MSFYPPYITALLKRKKTGDRAKIACLRHSSVYFVMQKDLLLQQQGRTIHSALAEENIRPTVVCHCKVLRPFFWVPQPAG